MNSSKNQKKGLKFDVQKALLASKKIRVISHPTRIEIINMLAETDSMSAGDITKRLSMGQPETSGHLILLKNFGILKKVRKGKMSLYSNNYELLDKIIRISDELYKRF